MPAAAALVHALLNQVDVPVHADMNPSFHMWKTACPLLCPLHIVHMLTMKVVHKKERKQTPQFSLETYVHINNYL